MDHFAGLDVSIKETSVCIVDDTGRIIRELKNAGRLPNLLVLRCSRRAAQFKIRLYNNGQRAGRKLNKYAAVAVAIQRPRRSEHPNI